MKDEKKLKVLKILMVVIGVFFFPGSFLISRTYPAAWEWQPLGNPAIAGMLMAIIVAWLICLIWAAWDPIRHIMIVWFSIISSFFHGGIMTVYAMIQKGLKDPHFLGDIPFIFAIGVLLLVFIPWKMLKQQQKKGPVKS